MAWYWSRGKIEPVGTQWNSSTAEQPDFRLEALYAWERRCRGYDLFTEPVEIEPQFSPYKSNLSLQQSGWDSIPQPRLTEQDHWAPLPILLPPGYKITADQVNALFTAWRSLNGPLALEVIADTNRITYQFATLSHETSAVAAFTSLLPEARLEEGQDALLDALHPLSNHPLGHCVVDWGLFHPAYQPLRLWDTLATTPHHALLGQLGTLRSGQVAGLQILAQPAVSAWADSLQNLVAQFDGTAAHPGTKDTKWERALRYKLASPLWAVAVRVFGIAAGNTKHASAEELSENAFDLCRRIGGVLDALGGADSKGLPANALVALDAGDYTPQDHLRDVIHRRSRRTGMLISQHELLGLWHPPTQQMNNPKLWRYDFRQRELPEELRLAQGSFIGTLISTTTKEPVLVPWPNAFRNRHAYLLGGTRMGKSTLIENLIVQDVLDGRGLCLIDPHGDLARDVLERIPPEREEDVLYLDLSDTAYPPAIGLFETVDEWEQRLLVSDLLAILHRLFRASWGDRLEHILRHTLLTLLTDTEKHTLRDIRPLLANKPYREQVLRRLPDADLRAFWNSDFQSYSSTSLSPIYNKLGLLMSSPMVRNIVSGKESKLHLGQIIQNRRILIVNLAQSLIGEDNAHFLGALLVSKIQLAAMHNLRHGRSNRAEFTLYVDEFQNFVVSSFEKILSEAGKAGLSLVMANQFLEQLSEGLQTAILSNVGTLVSFRVSAESGRRLESEFGGFYGTKELTDQERGHAVVRLGRAGDSYAIQTFAPVAPDKLGAKPGIQDAVIERTRAEVCRPRREVESEFRAAEDALERLLRQAEEDEQRAKAKPAAGQRTPSAGRATGKAQSPTDTYATAETDNEIGNPHQEGSTATAARDAQTASNLSSHKGSTSAKDKNHRRESKGTEAPPFVGDAVTPPVQNAEVEAIESSSTGIEGIEGIEPNTKNKPVSPSGPIFFGIAEEDSPA